MKSNDSRHIGAMLMFENLNETVEGAGGCTYTWEQLQGMSAADLLNRLGCNHVRFYNEPRHNR